MSDTRIGAQFARYAVPALIAMLVSGTYQIIAGIFVGRYIGSDGLAAINLAWPMVGVLLAVGLMVGIGIGSYVSLSRGAGKAALAASYIGQLPLLIIIPGLLLSLVLYYGGRAMLSLQGAEGQVLSYGYDFLKVIAFGAPLVLGSIAVPYLMRNLNAPRLATMFMVIGALMNIALDYLFIVVLHLELLGVALATLIAESTAMILALCYVFSRRSPVRLAISDFKVRGDLCWKICKNGSSSLFMYIYLSLTIVAYNFMFLRYGSVIEVAAYAVIGYLLTFYYLLSEGLAHGMQPLVSRFFGARDAVSSGKILKLAMTYSVGFGVVYTLAMLLFPTTFSDFFAGDDRALSEAIVVAIRLSLFMLFCQGFFVITEAFFQSIGEGHKALIITICNVLIQLPFLFILPRFLGTAGIWLAMPISAIVLAIPVIFLLIKQIRLMNLQLSEPEVAA
ncbi:Multidrug export protein mepA [Leminorella richardii]|uniref:Multidrug export protein MepA n=1 Tax=Leminorella richardii TaxID=158841 RepID=A0A2X4UY66_9GAMM|nr:MATE family efflux transporter [Leminorella richardii]SQI43823.1 Multidrug export protein mepA [Leminorella richardii]